MDEIKNIEERMMRWDEKLILQTKRLAIPFSRFAIFFIYFWFGALKVFSESPANPLVSALLAKTLPFITFPAFIMLFGLFEMLIGVLFIVPRMQRVAILLLIVHLGTTLMPLIVLPAATWQGFLTPTLEGQYIIKNILTVALIIGIFAHLHPLDEKKLTA